eukprot:scaffold1776_cov106-Cylindrotheca_fusiformis.AAC.4
MISPWMLRSTTRGVSKFVPTSFSKSLQKNTSSRGRRWLSVASSSSIDEPRESMAFDVLIVGGGPSGLSASIKLKQLNPDLSVCVMDKGSEIGSHIVSGNVFDPKAMQELFPSTENFDWRSEFEDSQGASATAVTKDQFTLLTETSSYNIPNLFLPSQLHNDGNYILSLSQLCRWLATQAEELGVEIYPGFAASEVLIDNNSNGVYGIATRDVGIGKDGTPKSTFERGMELHARQTLFAEGARGSCSEFLMKQFQLRGDKNNNGVMPQTYGLGIKEVWEIPEENLQPGFVQHTLGWPLQNSFTSDVFGGSFLYHLEPNLILAGVVVGLDYQNPYLNPYKEFQKWKTHPSIAKHFEGGTCISYGARVLNEGGYHAIPKLTFPGGALIGCSAGFLNAVKIKGTHTAMKSGMLAAEAVVEGLDEAGSVAETGELSADHVPQELTSFTDKFQNSWIHDELYEVRNCHQAFAKWGMGGGLVYTGLAAHITKGREPWTLDHTILDSDATKPSDNFEEIQYPPPDNKLTFDLLTNLQRSGTFHEDDQPAHLRIKPDKADIPKSISLQQYAGPEQRFCPASVYEYVEEKLVINAQNCVHCKCCSIKTPGEFIEWTVPEGGGGPQYQVM